MNNKIYKLIVEYPGSPKKGLIVTETEKGYEGLGIIFPSKKFIENYPNNWELQKQLDYEIIEIDKENKIISIKRISDGVCFRIGDEVKNSVRMRGKIIKIEIPVLVNRPNNKDIFITTDWSNVGMNLASIEHCKKLIFKTEDDVEIFEGDKYFYFRKHSWTFDEATANLPFYTVDKYSTNSLYFSTKEKTEEYIKMNKPEFSRNQIIKLLGKFSYLSYIPKEIFINYIIVNNENIKSDK